MPFLCRPLALAGVLALGATAVGCSHEHGPLTDTPDTTSLGTAGRWDAPYISTATGLAWRPSDPNAVIPGTVQGESSCSRRRSSPRGPCTGRARTGRSGRPSATRPGGRWVSGFSGPNLPVEPWNMALEAAGGEAAGEGHGHGGAKAQPN